MAIFAPHIKVQLQYPLVPTTNYTLLIAIAIAVDWLVAPEVINNMTAKIEIVRMVYLTLNNNPLKFQLNFSCLETVAPHSIGLQHAGIVAPESHSNIHLANYLRGSKYSKCRYSSRSRRNTVNLFSIRSRNSHSQDMIKLLQVTVDKSTKVVSKYRFCQRLHTFCS